MAKFVVWFSELNEGHILAEADSEEEARVVVLNMLSEADPETYAGYFNDVRGCWEIDDVEFEEENDEQIQ